MTAPGKVRVSAGATGGPSMRFDYLEDGRVFTVQWDPRESGMVIAEPFDQWSDPAGEPLDLAARERIFEGLWSLRTQGITAIIDASAPRKCPVPVRWNRGPGGFLVDIYDGDRRLAYMELGHGLMLRYHERPERLHVAFVEWPRSPCWTEPEGPISARRAARIRDRLGRVTKRDLRFGDNLPWRVVVEPEGAAG